MAGELPTLPYPFMRLSNTLKITIFAAAATLALSLGSAGTAAASTCPAKATQRSSTVVSFASTCYLSQTEWIKKFHGSKSKPPVPVGWTMSAPITRPPYRSKSKMIRLIQTYDGGNCNPKYCDGTTPGDAGGKFDKNPSVDPHSPAIKPICPPGYIISNVPKAGTKYTCVCALWTADDIDNPLLPPELAAVIEAGGYFPPTQYCILIPVKSAFQRVGPQGLAAPKATVAAAATRPPPTASPAKAKPVIYTFRERARITLAHPPNNVIKCGLTPEIIWSHLFAKNPKAKPWWSPWYRTVQIGSATAWICRLQLVRVKVPPLSAAQKKLIRKGNVAVAFKIIGLPSKGTKEKKRRMPYGAIKFLSTKAAPANGGKYRLVQANSQGVVVWIGKFKKTTYYRVRAEWPYYQWTCLRIKFNRTLPKKAKFTG